MIDKKYTIISSNKDNIIAYYWKDGKRCFDVLDKIKYYFYANLDLTINPKFEIIPGFKNIDGKKVHKIIPHIKLDYTDKNLIKDSFKGKIYESDFKDLDRWLCDIKPKFSKDLKKWYIDIETLKDEEGQYSTPNQAMNPVASITVFDSIANKYYVLLFNPNEEVKSIDKEDKKIVTFDKEESMLNFFIKLIRKLQPDIFTGWNIDGYDLPYLINRCKLLDIDINKISPLNYIYLKETNYKEGYLKFNIQIKGRGIIDLMEISKQFWLGTDVGYSLSAISKKYLNDDKIEIGDIDKAYKEDFWKFVDYNIKDVKLCVDLDNKLNLIKDMQEFQNIISINLEDTIGAGKLINYYIKQHTDIVLNNIHSKDDFNLPGGYVHPVAGGIYKNVKKYDFASHYPSVIRSYNISPDTIVYNPTEDEKKDLIHFKCKYQRINEKGTSGWRIVMPEDKLGNDVEDFEVWFRKDKGSITKIVDDLTIKRLKYKKEGSKSRSTVLKRVINCFTGDHDVLTPDGIKNIKDFKVGDKIYTLNPKKQKSELDKVIRVYKYYYEGDMYKFKNRGIDWMVTPNHRIYYRNINKGKNNGKLFYKEASEIYKLSRFNTPNIVEMPDNKSNNIINLLDYLKYNNGRHKELKKTIFKKSDFMKFLGIFISEGSFQYIKSSNSYFITLFQSRKVNLEICNQIEKFLNNMDIKWKNYDNKTYKICNKFLYDFCKKFCGKDSYNIRIPNFVWDFNNKDLRILYEYLMKGDGNKNGIRYSTVSKYLAKDFLYLCLRLGINAKMYYQTNCSAKTYRIIIRKRIANTINNNNKSIIRNYKGNVYCIECENNHIIMCGRNNKLKFIGQSIYGQYSFKYSRFFNKECSMTITLVGQWLIRSIIRYIEMNKIGNIILCDSDSVVVDLYKDKTEKDIDECVKYIFDKSKKEHNIDKVYSSLDLEANIEKLLLFGIKKKYAQLINGKIKVQGLEMIRKDCPLALKEFQEMIVKLILEKDNIGLSDVKFVKNYIETKIRKKITDNDHIYYSIPTVIRKPIEDYATETFEKKALRNSNLKISTNELFYVLPCVGKDYAFKNVSDLENIKYTVDYDKIVNKIFKNIKIFENLFITQKTLFNF